MPQRSKENDDYVYWFSWAQHLCIFICFCAFEILSRFAFLIWFYCQMLALCHLLLSSIRLCFSWLSPKPFCCINSHRYLSSLCCLFLQAKDSRTAYQLQQVQPRCRAILWRLLIHEVFLLDHHYETSSHASIALTPFWIWYIVCKLDSKCIYRSSYEHKDHG